YLQKEFDEFHTTFPDRIIPTWNTLLFHFLEKLTHFSWDIALKNKPFSEKTSISHAVPSFFVDRLIPVMSEKKIQANTKAMNPFRDQNYIALRIVLDKGNDEKWITVTRDKYLQYLHKKGIKTKIDPDIPFLIHVPMNQRKQISNSQLYRSNKIIFQDKSAVIACLLVDPQPLELILDVTAAPGMKTSLIQELTHNQSVIISGDIQRKRIKESEKLLSQLKTKNVHLIQWDGSKLPLRTEVKPRQQIFDKILLDAPCTGSGTFLNDPEMKWRQNKHILLKNSIIQEKILKQLKKYIHEGTTLIYTTCSLYPEEGEYQINKLINKPWFKEMTPQPLIKGISPAYSINESLTALITSQEKKIIGLGRIFPAKQHTQGFFYAKFARCPVSPQE
ncbi:MAG: RsmB/NOP family class I SAM-dependent RNA methyltransferase, partial [Promethearchaeota archaeon]